MAVIPADEGAVPLPPAPIARLEPTKGAPRVAPPCSGIGPDGAEPALLTERGKEPDDPDAVDGTGADADADLEPTAAPRVSSALSAEP